MALHKSFAVASLTLAASMGILLAGCQSNLPLPFGKNPPVAKPTTQQTAVTDGELLPSSTASSTRAFIQPEQLATDAPPRYTVVRGDTLWDISGRFLKEPWLWPNIWNANPQIEDPHWIYPGDELALEYVAGQPTLVISRDGKPVSITEPGIGAANAGNPDSRDNSGRQRLSPTIRYERLDQAIPTIAGNSIQQFLVRPKVVDSEILKSAAYVVGNYDNRLISAAGHQVYVRGPVNRNQTQYGIYRKEKALRDPVNNELLGYEVSHVADAKLLNVGDPSTMTITSNNMETIAGDIILEPNGEDTTHQYLPRMPRLGREGRVVSLVNAISQTGRDQVIVLNVGRNDNIKPGDVLAIEGRGETIIDTRGARGEETVTLPNLRTGVVMVFQTFDKVSYALVMESSRPVSINDIVVGI